MLELLVKFLIFVLDKLFLVICFKLVVKDFGVIGECDVNGLNFEICSMVEDEMGEVNS